MAREWPQAELLLELKGIMPGINYTEAERDVVRKAGGSTTIGIDGKVYMSRCGISTAGTPWRIVIHHRKLEEFCDVGTVQASRRFHRQ